MRMTCFAIVTACSLAVSSPLLAGHSDFGTITSEGEFRLNNSTVRGNATLISSPGGSVVEATRVPSRLQLHGGARIDLAPGARARVWADRLVLERGASDFTLPRRFAVEANTLRISPHQANTRASVGLHAGKTVQVAALNGGLRVHTAAGILVSNVEVGMAVAFEPQVTGPAAPSSFVGCVLKKDDKWVLYDTTTRIVVELRGTGFEGEWGNRVQANGTARAGAQPAEATTQVLDVTSITRIDSGGCSEVARAIGAQLPGAQRAAVPAAPKPGPSPTVTGGGMSAGAKVAIIGGVGAGVGVGAFLATQSDRSN
jgi:hypothetical protein